MIQSECPYLHKTVNMVVFFVKSNENNYPSCPSKGKREFSRGEDRSPLHFESNSLVGEVR